MQKMQVNTPLGTLIATKSDDPGHPGIWIDLRRPNATDDLQIALIEYCSGEYDKHLPNEGGIIAWTWGNWEQEEPTSKVVVKNIRDFFDLK